MKHWLMTNLMREGKIWLKIHAFCKYLLRLFVTFNCVDLVTILFRNKLTSGIIHCVTWLCGNLSLFDKIGTKDLPLGKTYSENFYLMTFWNRNALTLSCKPFVSIFLIVAWFHIIILAFNLLPHITVLSLKERKSYIKNIFDKLLWNCCTFCLGQFYISAQALLCKADL